jgi:hypothetical protein
MIEYDTVFRARRLVTAAGEDSGCVGVAGGRIAAISPLEAGLDVLPGVRSATAGWGWVVA